MVDSSIKRSSITTFICFNDVISTSFSDQSKLETPLLPSQPPLMFPQTSPDPIPFPQTCDSSFFCPPSIPFNDVYLNCFCSTTTPFILPIRNSSPYSRPTVCYM